MRGSDFDSGFTRVRVEVLMGPAGRENKQAADHGSLCLVKHGEDSFRAPCGEVGTTGGAERGAPKQAEETEQKRRKELNLEGSQVSCPGRYNKWNHGVLGCSILLPSRVHSGHEDPRCTCVDTLSMMSKLYSSFRRTSEERGFVHRCRWACLTLVQLLIFHSGAKVNLLSDN